MDSFNHSLKILFTLIAFLVSWNEIVLAADFCYNDPSCGPSVWDGQCQRGIYQSPVDLPMLNDTRNELLTAQFYPDKEYQTPIKNLTLINTGHSVQFLEKTGNSTCGIERTMVSDYLPFRYRFLQAHIHFGSNNSQGSEHTVMGQSFPMEIHLVHANVKYPSFEEALSSGSSQALAVIGIFVEVGEHNEELEQIVERLCDIPSANDAITYPVSFSLMTLLPKVPSVVYRYFGSLTTPPCNEQVEWTVFYEPIYCSETQLEKFRSCLKDSHGHEMSDNFRPVQNLNTRTLKSLNAYLHLH